MTIVYLQILTRNFRQIIIRYILISYSDHRPLTGTHNRLISYIDHRLFADTDHSLFVDTKNLLFSYNGYILFADSDNRLGLLADTYY